MNAGDVLPERTFKMKTLLSPIALVFCLAVSAGPSLAAECSGSAMWRVVEDGAEMIFVKEGSGTADFMGNGSQLPAVALQVHYTTINGEKGQGTLWGPMRSMMFFGPPVEMLDDMGFSWQAPSEDENGHYTVRSDDGQTVLFNLAFDHCL